MQDDCTLRFELFDTIMVVVHADAPPSVDEWRRMLLVRDSNRYRLRGMLVVAPPRAAITQDQRADVLAFLKETGSRIAVLTESALLRGIATAMRMVGLHVKAFAMHEVAMGLEYLNSVPRQTGDIVRRVAQIRGEFERAAATRKGD